MRGESFLAGGMGGEAGVQIASGPLISASSSTTFPLSLGPACTSHPLASFQLHITSTAPVLIYSLCSCPRRLTRTPLQTTRSHTASCRRLPSVTTLTSQCRKGMEVSTVPGTMGPLTRSSMALTSSSSSSGCTHTPASRHISRL